MRLDGYIRVSRVGARQGDGYISPDVQREAITGYAKELGGTIAAWHDDQDFSGGNTERPGFEAALERLESQATDGLVVMRIDRFSRSTADGYRIIREVVDRGQVFASCHERIDPQTPEGKFMLRSFLSNGELFLDQAKAQWWTAKSRAVARGVHIGPTPIGYARQPSQPLEPDPVYGPAIGKLFERAATGAHGDTALARWMTERAPRDGGPWQPSEVRRWLSNRVYLGEVKYGKLINPNAHPALTDAMTWAQCQREPGQQRRPHSTFLLSGFVRCACCRYSMGGQTYGGAAGITPVYRCNGKHGCGEPSVITAERLDGYMRELVAEHMDGLELEAAAEGIDLAAVDKEWEAAETELQAFAADPTARQVLGEAGWQNGLATRAARRDTAHEARGEAYARAKLAGVTKRVGDLDDHALRDLLQGLVRYIFVRRQPRGATVGDRVHVVWSDEADLDVPGPHRSGPFESIGW